MIYNTVNLYNVPQGLVVNTGTPSNPIWSSFQLFNNLQGIVTNKLRYLGIADANKTVVVDKFLEFRISQSGGVYSFQVRLIDPITTNMVYRYTRIGYQTSVNNGYNQSITFTPANYNTWQTIDSPGTIIASALGFHGSFSSPSRDRLHEIILELSFNEFVNLAINSY